MMSSASKYEILSDSFGITSADAKGIFTVGMSVTAVPPIVEFTVSGLKPGLLASINDQEQFTIRVYGETIFTAHLLSADLRREGPATITRLAFEDWSQYLLKKTKITKVYNDQTLQQIVQDVVTMSGVNDSVVGGSDVQIEEIVFYQKSAHAILSDLASEFEYLSFVSGGTVVFDNATPYSSRLTPHTVRDSHLISAQNVRIGGSANGIDVMFRMHPSIRAGDEILFTTGQRYIVHTIIHTTPDEVLYFSNALLVPTNATIPVLKRYNYDRQSNFANKILRLLDRKLEDNRPYIVGEMNQYDGEMHTIKAKYGQENFPSQRRSNEIAVTGTNEVQNRPILTQSAIGQGGWIVPCYVGERVVFMRLDDKDLVVLGKLFMKNADLPPHEPGDTIRHIPITEPNVEWDGANAFTDLIDKDGKFVMKSTSFKIQIGTSFVTLSRPDPEDAGKLLIDFGGGDSLEYDGSGKWVINATGDVYIAGESGAKRVALEDHTHPMQNHTHQYNPGPSPLAPTGPPSPADTGGPSSISSQTKVK